MKKVLLTTLAIALTASSGIALAKKDPFAEADAAIQYRQKVFSLMAANMGDIGAALKGKKSLEADVIQRRAEAVRALSLLPLDAFRVTGSDGGDSEAKAEIWSRFADFEEKMQQLTDASTHLAKVSGEGDTKLIGAAFKKTYQSCKGCHDSYKKD